MTRAKNNLTVHLNGRYLNHIRTENLIYTKDDNKYGMPEKLAVQLSHRDVWLDFFISRQQIVNSLQSGDILYYKDGRWLTKEGIRVFYPSKSFTEKMERIMKNGYMPKFAKVSFVVFWKKEGEEKDIKIILPEVHFHREKS